MEKVGKHEMHLIAPLFQNVEDSMVIACLQGYMGDAYADRLPNPCAGLIVSGEYSFFAGDAKSEGAHNLVRNIFKLNPGETTVAIFGYDNPEWENLLLSVPENHPQAVPRFGIAQKDYDFDLALLQRIIDSLPEGFQMQPFNKDLYLQAMAEDWSKEFCETFADAEDYLKKGFGFAALHDGKLVSGASTMTVYDGGTEIQTATRENFRQKGLALPCCAALIRECVKRGMRACWDAANLISKHMALKLGYEYRGEYTTIHMHR
jgi:GNAT superfamily N-acetyltransferase